MVGSLSRRARAGCKSVRQVRLAAFCFAGACWPLSAAGQDPAGPALPTLTPPPVEPSPAGAEADVPPDQDPRDVALTRPANRPWRVGGEAQYRSLLVTDDDPANDRYMLYRVQGAYYPLPWLSVFARLGLNQRFVSVQGESGFRMDDVAIGATAEQRVALLPLVRWPRTLALSHSLRVYLPTSFQSAERDLYFALEGSTRARVRVVDELFAGLRGSLHYRFYEFAEQAGPEGATLPRFIVELRPFVEYTPFSSEKWGTVTVGADVFGDETVDYPSRDPASIPASELPPGTLAGSDGAIAGSGSSDSYVTPHYGYDLYAVYTPPIPHLSFSLSLEQSGNVVRYGEARLYFLHRDQTEVALRVIGTY